MGKIKVQRSSTSIDMTPMVDLAFLLVTFFMLTTKFAPEEPLAVDMPTSVSEIKLPDTDILTISISKEGIVFFNMDGKYNREELLAKMGEKYQVQFSPEEIRSFSLLSSMGVPVGNLKQFLSMPPEERKLVKQPGIPCDSLNNELADWVIFSRTTNPKLRIAIKGDRDAEYPVIKNVITTLIDKKVNRFNLITNMEGGS
ncbi:MAG TPA: biopolymer transporter ExbD [Chryseolinea sp.]|jgi:biopolymer transport protein ExbD|nr:biopolymer transporter ExbD [Chryseolinea sp.]